MAIVRRKGYYREKTREKKIKKKKIVEKCSFSCFQVVFSPVVQTNMFELY